MYYIRRMIALRKRIYSVENRLFQMLTFQDLHRRAYVISTIKLFEEANTTSLPFVFLDMKYYCWKEIYQMIIMSHFHCLFSFVFICISILDSTIYYLVVINIYHLHKVLDLKTKWSWSFLTLTSLFNLDSYFERLVFKRIYQTSVNYFQYTLSWKYNLFHLINI